MPKFDDLSRSLVALDQDSTLIAVIELSRSSWLVGGMVSGLGREPLKKLARTRRHCWDCCTGGGEEAAAAGRRVARI